MLQQLSLITSLYRSEIHLAVYIQRLRALATTLLAENINLELIIVANDASSEEKKQLEEILKIPSITSKQIHVPRETLYASWNRGVAAASNEIIGFWNVDDFRSAAAIIEALEVLHSGAELVDMPYYIAPRPYVNTNRQAPFDAKNLSPKRCLSPFFLFKRQLFEEAGAFNPNFKVAGDFEWCSRPRVRASAYKTLSTIGGYFILHGNNLSNGTQPLEWVEINLVLLWHQAYEQLRPVDPQLMQTVWSSGAGKGQTIPENIENWLWGDAALSRFKAYQKERNAPAFLRKLRLALARRGIIQSIEWDAHHKPKV